MDSHSVSLQKFGITNMPGQLFALCVLVVFMAFSASIWAEAANTDQQATDTGQANSDDAVAETPEEVNTNDPTAAAISVSADRLVSVFPL